MKYQFFSVPVMSGEQEQEKLNAFCTQHRIIDIDKQLIQQKEIHYWSFCISYIDTEISLDKTKSVLTDKKRIDYKDVLNEDDFNKFSKLRDLRKALAEQSGVPVYAVFTNEQLATMVQQKMVTLVQLQKIEGIGRSRLEKYGDRFLACLTSLFNEA